MSYEQPNNPYYYPEKMGLTQIGMLSDPNACYDYDDLVVWQHEDGRLFWAADSGCSCPTPFEYYTTLESLNLITPDTWRDFEYNVESHCSHFTDKSELLSDVRRILRK